MRFSFIILHYQNIEDTCNCIESILKQENKYNNNVQIIIIDNNSPNGTGELLKKKYQEQPNIEFVLLNENVGFSKANNIGFLKAKSNKADLIMVSNNDIIIEDTKFIDQLYCFYKQNFDYHVIAVDIVNAEGKHQNPRSNKIKTKNEAYIIMIRKYISYILLYIPVIRWIIAKKHTKKIVESISRYYKKITSKDDFIPFGAFVIFTNSWICKENIAFPCKTFMYAEEEHLSYYMKIKKYKIIYAPNLKVKHLSSRSVRTLGNLYKSMRFQSKNVALANKEYIEFIKDVERSKNDYSNNSNL